MNILKISITKINNFINLYLIKNKQLIREFLNF